MAETEGIEDFLIRKTGTQEKRGDRMTTTNSKT
jgi:hypothetical protein